MQIPGFYLHQKLQYCLVPTAEQGSDQVDPCYQVHPQCLSRETQVHPVCTAWKPPPHHWLQLGYGHHTRLVWNSLTWRHLHKSKPILLSSHWKYPNSVFCKLCCVGKFWGFVFYPGGYLLIIYHTFFLIHALVHLQDHIWLYTKKVYIFRFPTAVLGWKGTGLLID